eukprot:10372120-Lingulodinium_polyedra.AAC.1
MAVPRGPAGVDAGDLERALPHGHYMEAAWPVTKARYPAREEPRSWKKHEELAETYACVVKLGGRQTAKRTARAMGRIV